MINRGVHHDGSEIYVSSQSPQLNEVITVTLRTSSESVPDRVFLRTVADGEPQFFEAKLVAKTASDNWWRTTLRMHNPYMHYRWLVSGGDFNYSWLNAQGLVDHDVPDTNDFFVSSTQGPPAWALSEPVYQIFPDRFARSRDKDQVMELAGAIPRWAVPRTWNDHPEGRGPNTPFEYFGGDLWGAAEKLDYIDELGCGVLYSTPVFPAGSTHRYDAETFDEIDSLLGGDQAMHNLVNKLHARGMYFLGDITLNHCGVNHRWFEMAQDPSSEEHEFFTFNADLEHGYESWCGVPSLPKLNYSSQLLRERFITSESAPLRTWLQGESGWDGWRVDVANMSGRLRELDLTHEIARLTRQTMSAQSDELVLLAEHGHDASGDLLGDGWHGTMNYAGFTRPVWAWLRADNFQEEFMGVPAQVPQISGQQAVDTIRAFHGQIPWRALLASWNILSSHDTARIRSVVGTAERQEAAIAMAIGLPGIPMVFAEDEIGAQGLWGEDSRTPFPWHKPEVWDQKTLATYRTLLNLRRSNPVLAKGGLRWVAVSDNVIIFTRDLEDESLLFVVARSASDQQIVDLQQLGLSNPVSMFGFSAQSENHKLVVDVPHAGAGVWLLKGNASWQS